MRKSSLLPFAIGLAPAVALAMCVAASVFVAERWHDGSLNWVSVMLFSFGYVSAFGLSVYICSDPDLAVPGRVTLASLASLAILLWALGMWPLAALLTILWLPVAGIHVAMRSKVRKLS